MYNSSWSNLLQLTIGGKKEQYGDRTPAIFFHEKYGMMVASAINGQKSCQPKNGSKYWNLPELGKWADVVVGQQKEEVSDDVHFYMSINNVEIIRVLNTKPMNFSNVKVNLCHSLCQKQPINKTVVRYMWQVLGMLLSPAESEPSPWKLRLKVP